MKPGRPRRTDDLAAAHITMRVTARERVELRRMADANGMRVSSVIREAVNAFVADYGDPRVFRTTKS
jgi:hypothetical protein